jgi:Fe-S cluster biogenesis protein NfuA
MEIQAHGPSREAVEAALDRIRPGLVADGGNLELIDVGLDGIVRVEFQGACATCPAQIATLRVAIEEPLRARVPGVTAVVPG